MITLISASMLTFIITIILTSIVMSACQRLFAKKFRSTCTGGLCLSNSCNNLNNEDLCRTLSSNVGSTAAITNGLLINNTNFTNDLNPMNNQLNNMNSMNNMNNLSSLNNAIVNMSNLNLNTSINALGNNLNATNLTNPTNLTSLNNNNVNNLNTNTIDQFNGPISNCSSTSTDQCTIDTNSTLLTNLTDSTNNSNCQSNHNQIINSLPLNTINSSTAINISPNTISQQTSVSGGLNRITNAIASITNLLTNNNTRNHQFQLTSSDNSLFHISGNDQLNQLIRHQPPPPAYELNTTTLYTPYDDIQQQQNQQTQDGYSQSFYYNNELCT